MHPRVTLVAGSIKILNLVKTIFILPTLLKLAISSIML